MEGTLPGEHSCVFPSTEADLAGTFPPEKLHEETVSVNKNRRWGERGRECWGKAVASRGAQHIQHSATRGHIFVSTSESERGHSPLFLFLQGMCCDVEFTTLLLFIR